MHRYRSHTCGALREGDIGKVVRLSGWCHRIRDHGGVLFINLRDHYGITQVVADPDSKAFKLAEQLRAEWVVRIDGTVRARPAGTENPELPTGEVEVVIEPFIELSQSASGTTRSGRACSCGCTAARSAAAPSRPCRRRRWEMPPRWTCA